MSAEGVPAFITIFREIRTFRSVYEGDRNSIIRRVGDLEDTLSEDVRRKALPSLSKSCLPDFMWRVSYKQVRKTW